jgi:hypothetical protein
MSYGKMIHFLTAISYMVLAAVAFMRFRAEP